MKTIWTIARRELKAVFDHPTGYILLVVFLVVNDFLFFRRAYLVGVASLRPMLDLLPWILLFFVPAVTMRAVAEDRRTGTLEVVLAQPVTEVELLAGKYVGQLLVLWIALALTLPIPLGLSAGADLQAGVVVAQYAGSALLVAGLAAIGVWASSITPNQITAFIVGVAVMFVLILVGAGPLVTGLPPALSGVAVRLSVLSHFENIARGVIDLRDAVYFVTLGGVFLALAYLAVQGRKLSPVGAALKRLRLGTGLLAVTLVVVNLFGRHIGGRLDLTPGRAYTLSDAAQAILRSVDDLITVKLFVSKELPPEVALLRRDLDDLLSDIRTAAGGNLQVVQLDPGGGSDAESEARALGIPPVQFNVIGESEFKVREGYLGLAVQYADRSETIPFVDRTDDLEYRLVSFIRALTRTDTSVVAVMESGADAQRGETFAALRQELERSYQVLMLAPSDTARIPEGVRVLVLLGSPPVVPDSVVARVATFLAQGGSALVAASGTMVQPPFAAPRPVGWNRVLEVYGVSIGADMVYDLASNERVTLQAQQGPFRVLANYPPWVRGLSTRRSPVNQDIESLLFPWSSTVDTAGAAPEAVVPLFTTSRAGGVESGRTFIAPQREFPQEGLGPRLLAALVTSQAASANGRPPGRLVVVGNHTMFTDGFAATAPGGLVLALNAVDWLAQDAALIAIRARDRTPPPLVFESDLTRDLVKYGNVVGVPLLLVLFAGVRLWRRRRRTRQRYEPLAAGAPS